MHPTVLSALDEIFRQVGRSWCYRAHLIDRLASALGLGIDEAQLVINHLRGERFLVEVAVYRRNAGGDGLVIRRGYRLVDREEDGRVQASPHDERSCALHQSFMEPTSIRGVNQPQEHIQ
jgi:hypothetical protein